MLRDQKKRLFFRKKGLFCRKDNVFNREESAPIKSFPYRTKKVIGVLAATHQSPYVNTFVLQKDPKDSVLFPFLPFYPFTFLPFP
jgi:hypothetical protein